MGNSCCPFEQIISCQAGGRWDDQAEYSMLVKRSIVLHSVTTTTPCGLNDHYLTTYNMELYGQATFNF